MYAWIGIFAHLEAVSTISHVASSSISFYGDGTCSAGDPVTPPQFFLISDVMQQGFSLGDVGKEEQERMSSKACSVAELWSDVNIVTKNTFLTVLDEQDRELARPLRRSSSLPLLSSC